MAPFYQDGSRSSTTEEAENMLRSEFKDVELEFEDSYAPAPKTLRRLAYPISLISNLLFFIFILFLLAQPCYFSARTCIYEKRDKQLPLMADVNKIVPEIPTKEVVFMNNSHYSTPTMFHNEAEFTSILRTWKHGMPLGRGFIVVPNSTAYPYLSRPWHMSSVPGDGYSIAYLHQYHCLYMIMKSHGEYRFNKPSGDKDVERHVTHCFDYLRQSFLCSGDSALEGKSATDGLDMTDGWGDRHICKDPRVLEKWVLDHRFSDKKGID